MQIEFEKDEDSKMYGQCIIWNSYIINTTTTTGQYDHTLCTKQLYLVTHSLLLLCNIIIFQTYQLNESLQNDTIS